MAHLIDIADGPAGPVTAVAFDGWDTARPWRIECPCGGTVDVLTRAEAWQAALAHVRCLDGPEAAAA